MKKLEAEIEILQKQKDEEGKASASAEEEPAEAAVDAEDSSNSSSSDSDSSTCPYCREAAEVEQKLRKRVRSAHKAGCKNRKRRKGGGRQKESVQKKA